LTAIFGSILFFAPAIFAATQRDSETNEQGSGFSILRAALPVIIAAIGGLIITLPFWSNIPQTSYHAWARASTMCFCISVTSRISVVAVGRDHPVPAVHLQGGIRNGSQCRLVPAFYAALLVALGDTTPVAHMLLGRFNQPESIMLFWLWATLLALPFVGLLAARVIHELWHSRVIGGMRGGAVNGAHPDLAEQASCEHVPFRTESILEFP